MVPPRLKPCVRRNGFPFRGVQEVMTVTAMLSTIRRSLVVLVAVVLLGYLSSILSRTGSERAAAEYVAGELGHRDVYVLSSSVSSPLEYPGSAAILVRSGFQIRECREQPTQWNCFPWAGVSSSTVVGPFFVDVRWGFAAAGLSGRGSRTRYLAIFGFVVPLRDLGGWVS